MLVINVQSITYNETLDSRLGLGDWNLILEYMVDEMFYHFRELRPACFVLTFVQFFVSSLFVDEFIFLLFLMTLMFHQVHSLFF